MSHQPTNLCVWKHPLLILIIISCLFLSLGCHSSSTLAVRSSYSSEQQRQDSQINSEDNTTTTTLPTNTTDGRNCSMCCDRTLHTLFILNQALLLEHMENSFYRDALQSEAFSLERVMEEGTITDAQYFSLLDLSDHEAQHTSVLMDLIEEISHNRLPIAQPCEYQFGYGQDFQKFLVMAAALQNSIVSAYTALINNSRLVVPDSPSRMVVSSCINSNGTASPATNNQTHIGNDTRPTDNIKETSTTKVDHDHLETKVLNLLTSIAAVEARHASYLNSLIGTSPFPTAFEQVKPLAAFQIFASQFIASCPPESNYYMPLNYPYQHCCSSERYQQSRKTCAAVSDSGFGEKDMDDILLVVRDSSEDL